MLDKTRSMLLNSRRAVMSMIIIKDSWGQNKVIELVNIFTRENLHYGRDKKLEKTVYEKYTIIFQFRNTPKEAKYNEYVERTWFQVENSLGEEKYLKLVKTFYENHIHNKKTLV